MPEVRIALGKGNDDHSEVNAMDMGQLRALGEKGKSGQSGQRDWTSKQHGVWYHGSDQLFETLRLGSTITQWRELAEAFAHQPTWVSIDDDYSINHDGIKSGYLYIVAEPINATTDLAPVPNSTMEPGMEWRTLRPLQLTLITRLHLPTAKK